MSCNGENDKLEVHAQSWIHHIHKALTERGQIQHNLCF